eukprot:m.111332 g.111332  ORF g.111332 m.111332 type:complete len:398 (-) comp14354_c1_seq3:122-1315(-)
MSDPPIRCHGASASKTRRSSSVLWAISAVRWPSGWRPRAVLRAPSRCCSRPARCARVYQVGWSDEPDVSHSLQAGAGPPAKHLGHGPCDTRTRTRTLPTATTDPDVILRTALALLAAAAPAPTDVRGVGLTLARLAPPSAPHAAAARLAAPLSDGDNDDDDDWALGEETGRHRKEKTTKRKTVAAEEKTKKRKEEFEELPTVSQLDPSVLAALPAALRAEVLATHCRPPARPHPASASPSPAPAAAARASPLPQTVLHRGRKPRALPARMPELIALSDDDSGEEAAAAHDARDGGGLGPAATLAAAVWAAAEESSTGSLHHWLQVHPSTDEHIAIVCEFVEKLIQGRALDQVYVLLGVFRRHALKARAAAGAFNLVLEFTQELVAARHGGQLRLSPV